MPIRKFSQKTLILALIFVLLAPSVSQAATFNPHYILSDEEMQQWQAMTREDIAAFLTGKGGYISSIRTEDKNGMVRDAADIIARAAQEYSINPKYILVKLQKEQSLVTDPDPTQKQLDWATGYSVCDSCSMDDPAIQKNKGFGKQVDAAAGIMRWYYDNASQLSWIKKPNVEYAIDDLMVSPVNKATAFLYTYTPHIQGNKNFWTLWQKWFDQVYPDGTLIKSPDDPTVYLIRDGKKRPFKSLTALTTRYNPKLIVQAPASELARYETGRTIALPNFSILKHGGNYYLLDDDTLRPFANADTVKKIGYNPDEIMDVTADDLQGYLIGNTITEQNANPTGRIVKVKENKAFYHIKDGQYFPIADQKIAQANFPHLTIEQVTASALADLTRGTAIIPKDGTLFGVEGEHNIYVMENGKKRHIASEQVFNGLGYSMKNVIQLNQFAGLSIEAGEPLYVRIETTTPATATPNSTPNKTVTAPAPAAPQFVFKNTLKTGSKNSEVKELQKRLRALGLFTHPSDTGLFGGETRNALKAYQKLKKIPQTGTVDVATRKALNATSPAAAPTTVTKTVTPTPTVTFTGEALKIQNSKDRMYRTPTENTSYTGPIFGTQIDSYLVAEYDSGTVLAGKNIDVIRPIASFTKVMAAYEFFKQNIDLSAATTYDISKHKPPYDKYLIGNGDQVLNRDLLNSMLVSSLNTPAWMLATQVASNIPAFSALMNTEARNLGLTKTTFTDPSGYDLGNKSTAREYLTIFRTAMNHSDVAQFLNTKSYSYSKLANVSGKKSDHFDEHSNYLTKTTHSTYTILGSKTGYLDESGSGLAMLVERASDKKKFVIITMGNPDYPNRFVDPNKLTEWSMQNF